MAISNRLPDWVTNSRQYICAKEAADFLGCSIDAIHDSIRKKNGIPGVKMTSGRTAPYRIPKRQFLKWAKFEVEDA